MLQGQSNREAKTLRTHLPTHDANTNYYINRQLTTCASMRCLMRAPASHGAIPAAVITASALRSKPATDWHPQVVMTFLKKLDWAVTRNLDSRET